MTARTTESESPDWQHVLDGDDETEFRSLVEPFLDTLIDAAAQDLEYYVRQGDLHADDLTPEEVTGEALVYAWKHRAQRPEGMSLEGWLMGMQYRVLQDLVATRKEYRSEKALSLDEPIPPSEWRKGHQERRQYPRGFQGNVDTTWEELATGREPKDVEAPLFANADTFSLDPDSRHVVMMHDEFDVPLHEVATTMNRALQDTERLLNEARTTLRDAKREE